MPEERNILVTFTVRKGVEYAECGYPTWPHRLILKLDASVARQLLVQLAENLQDVEVEEVEVEFYGEMA